MHEPIPVSGLIAITSSVLAAAILVAYLIKQPELRLGTQLWLLFGLGILPIGTALAGNVAGMHATKEVRFCGSCHVMLAHTGDARDPNSQSLAARHTKNEMFGGESCYTCHADYGLFGAVFTKINGMHHVVAYLSEYRSKTLDEALPELALYKPFPNHNCMQCHSGNARLWRDVGDHASSRDALIAGKVSCASEGCHGFAHPFTKAARRAKEAAEGKTAPAGQSEAHESEEVRP
jgi:cytochrome c-type protein NapC